MLKHVHVELVIKLVASAALLSPYFAWELMCWCIYRHGLPNKPCIWCDCDCYFKWQAV